MTKLILAALVMCACLCLPACKYVTPYFSGTAVGATSQYATTVCDDKGCTVTIPAQQHYVPYKGVKLYQTEK